MKRDIVRLALCTWYTVDFEGKYRPTVRGRNHAAQTVAEMRYLLLSGTQSVFRRNWGEPNRDGAKCFLAHLTANKPTAVYSISWRNISTACGSPRASQEAPMTRSVALSHPASNVLRHSAALLERLFPPPRHFTIEFWEGTKLPAADAPAFSLVLKHPGALRRMFAPPIELSLGEAFIYGDFDLAGDIFAATNMMDSFGSWVL